MTAALAAANAYLDRGISVLPLKREDKRPVGRWKQLQREPMSHDVAALWWGGKLGDFGLGVITGDASGGLTVLDIEPEHVDYAKRNLAIPDTPTVTTARGGLHVYCREAGERRCGKLRVGDRVVGDVRSRGGYVVAPPTVIRDGIYAWHGPESWSVGDLAPVPEWAGPAWGLVKGTCTGWGASASPSPWPEPPSPVQVPLTSLQAYADGLAGVRQLAGQLSSRTLLAINAPYRQATAFHPRRRASASEIDFAVLCECVRAGASFDLTAQLFEAFPIGINAATHHMRSLGYLETAYYDAQAAVEREADRAVWVRCLRVIVGQQVAFRDGPSSQKRAYVQVFRPHQPGVYSQSIPMVLGAPYEGQLSGEWRRFCRAFGVEPSYSIVAPRGRAKAVLDGDRIVRFF